MNYAQGIGGEDSGGRCVMRYVWIGEADPERPAGSNPPAAIGAVHGLLALAESAKRPGAAKAASGRRRAGRLAAWRGFWAMKTLL